MAQVVDVGILTVIPVEIEAVFSAFAIDNKVAQEAQGSQRYWRANIVSRIDHRVLNLAISFLTGTQGNIESAVSAAFMLEILKPRLMCLVGIAAGAAGKTRIGDVVVPDVVHDVTVTVRKDNETQPRRRSCDLDPRLLQQLKLRSLAASTTLRASLTKSDEAYRQLVDAAIAAGLESADIANPPIIRDGSLVSGNALLRDKQYFPDFQSSSDERCRAADMESAGFVRACVIARCPWIVVRGVSDYGDARKDDSCHQFAAYNASITLREFLQAHWNTEEFERVGAGSSTQLTNTLEQSLTDEYAKKNYNYVVEVGKFLSRPLWLSGNLELQRRMGEMVEDAAAACDLPGDRARALIDDIGWTSVKLGDLLHARKAISDGLRLARETEDWYLCAKASRHLASVARQTGQMEECEVGLSSADAFARQIPDTGRRVEMETSLVVSRAKMLIANMKQRDAVTLLEEARAKYRSSRDLFREVKVFHPLGQARMAMGDVTGGIAEFEEGYRFAVQCGRKDEALTNAIELAGTYSDTGDARKARIWAVTAVRLAMDLSDYQLPSHVVLLANATEEVHDADG